MTDTMIIGSSLFSLIIGLCIAFLPSALAVLKGNIYKGQVIKYQLIVIAISILVKIAVIFINRLLKATFIIIICAIGSKIWSITAIVLWFYILIHAFKDKELTLLSRFGINI